MWNRCITIAGILFGWGIFAAGDVLAKEPPATQPIMVILKLDDVTTNGAHGNEPVSQRWQRTADFIASESIKANFGIIGWSLESAPPKYCEWIKEWDKKGTIEFWNHGYHERKSDSDLDEFAASLDVQKEALRKTQELAKEKLGITLKAFGAHWSAANDTTPIALATRPEIRLWFAAGPQNKTQPGQLTLVTNRLEQPTFIPNADNLSNSFAKWTKGRNYLVLQGHPNKWDDERYATFVKIVKFLKDKGCKFVTVSEYLETVDKPAAK